MDDERAVLRRLDRIDRLQRGGAPAADLLAEVRGLLRAAERLSTREPDADLAAALGRCQEALFRGTASTPAANGDPGARPAGRRTPEAALDRAT